MPTTFCVRTRDNRWISQKLSMEKNTIGNEPYIEKATVLGSFFVLRETYIENIDGLILEIRENELLKYMLLSVDGALAASVSHILYINFVHRAEDHVRTAFLLS